MQNIPNNPYEPHSNNLPPAGPSINNHQNIQQGNPYSIMSLPISSERQLNHPISSNPDINQQMNKKDSNNPHG